MNDTVAAATILALHVLIIAFNVAGLIIIPIGAWQGWRLVRFAWLRIVHLALLAIVAGQALAGRACFLTIWQNELTGGRQAPTPLLMTWIDSLIFWNLPFWCFTVLYGAVFIYVIALSFLVPFGRRSQTH